MRMRKWVPTLVLLVLLAPAARFPQSKNTKSGVYEQLNLFGEAFERIRQDAVEPVADRKLIETAIAGMLASLDPHCVYLSEAEYKALQAPAQTDTGSIGLVVTLDSGQVKVVSPRDGSPAAAAGIKPGETIFAIDKEPVFDLTLSEVEQKLRGPVDSEVTLTLRRADGKPADITLKRSDAKLTTVDLASRRRRCRLYPHRRVRRHDPGGAYRGDPGFAAEGGQEADRLCPRSAQRSRRRF